MLFFTDHWSSITRQRYAWQIVSALEISICNISNIHLLFAVSFRHWKKYRNTRPSWRRCDNGLTSWPRWTCAVAWNRSRKRSNWTRNWSVQLMFDSRILSISLFYYSQRRTTNRNGRRQTRRPKLKSFYSKENVAHNTSTPCYQNPPPSIR